MQSGSILRWIEDQDQFEILETNETDLTSGSAKLLFSTDSFFAVSTKTGVSFIPYTFDKSLAIINQSIRRSLTEQIIFGFSHSPDNFSLISRKTIYNIELSDEIPHQRKLSLPDELSITAAQSLPHGHLLIATKSNEIIRISLSNLEIIEKISTAIDRGTYITDIQTTNDNFILGTNNGIYVTDRLGVPINHFDRSNSDLSHNYITKILIDEPIWIGTYQGIDQLATPKNIVNTNSRNSIIYSDVQSFEETIDGNLWVGTYNGLFLREKSNGKHSVVDWISSSLPSNKIMTMLQSGDKLWLGLEGEGVLVANLSDKSTSIPFRKYLFDASITKIFLDSNSRIWIASYNKGIFYVNESNELTKVDSIDETGIIGIYETREKVLVAISETNLYIYSSSERKFRRASFSGEMAGVFPTIFSILSTSDGLVLFGTKDHGIFTSGRISSEKNNIYTARLKSDLNISTLTIYALHEDRAGNIWASTNSGIYIFYKDGRPTARLTRSSGLQGNDFNFGSHYQTKDGSLIFGGVHGYNIISPDNFYVSSNTPQVHINSISLPGHVLYDRNVIHNQPKVIIPEGEPELRIQFSISDFIDTRFNVYKFRLTNFDDDWQYADHHGLAIYRHLIPGSYKFTVIGANANGVWSKKPAVVDISVSPNRWRTKYAYCLYVFALCLIALALQKIRKINLDRLSALTLADQLHDKSIMMQNEFIEEQEYHDEVIAAVHKQNQLTLDLVDSCFKVSLESDRQTHAFTKYFDCLRALENSYSYQTGHLSVNLHDYVAELERTVNGGRSTGVNEIVTINRASNDPLRADLASPLAVIIFELYQNALRHAFVHGEPVGYVEIYFAPDKAPPDDQPCYRLCVSDDGVGIPRQFDILTTSTPGFAVTRQLCQLLSAKLEDSSDEEMTRIEVLIPVATLFPMAATSELRVVPPTNTMG